MAAFASAVERVDRGAIADASPPPAPFATSRPSAVEVQPRIAQSPHVGPDLQFVCGLSIDEVSRRELQDVMRWLSSGPLLTDEELVREAVRELGFRRRGARIEAALLEAIAALRRP